MKTPSTGLSLSRRPCAGACSAATLPDPFAILRSIAIQALKQMHVGVGQGWPCPILHALQNLVTRMGKSNCNMRNQYCRTYLSFHCERRCGKCQRRDDMAILGECAVREGLHCLGLLY